MTVLETNKMNHINEMKIILNNYGTAFDGINAVQHLAVKNIKVDGKMDDMEQIRWSFTIDVLFVPKNPLFDAISYIALENVPIIRYVFSSFSRFVFKACFEVLVRFVQGGTFSKAMWVPTLCMYGYGTL